MIRGEEFGCATTVPLQPRTRHGVPNNDDAVEVGRESTKNMTDDADGGAMTSGRNKDWSESEEEELEDDAAAGAVDKENDEKDARDEEFMF